MQFAAADRKGWADVFVMVVLTSLVAWLFYRYAETPRTPTPAAASPVPVVAFPSSLIVVEATKVPTQPTSSPTPTAGPCSYDTESGSACVWTGAAPPTPTPIVPECRPGAATPGAVCQRIPILPTPTPTEICVESYGVGNCVWPEEPAATPG